MRLRGRINIDQFTSFCRFGVGAVFFAAGVAKLLSSGAFLTSLSSYGFVPVRLRPVVGLLLPLGEISLGLVLTSGLLVRTACAAAIFLLGSFTAAVLVAYASGQWNGCGCFGSWSGGDLAVVLLRNLLLLATASFVYARSGPGAARDCLVGWANWIPSGPAKRSGSGSRVGIGLDTLLVVAVVANLAVLPWLALRYTQRSAHRMVRHGDPVPELNACDVRGDTITASLLHRQLTLIQFVRLEEVFGATPARRNAEEWTRLAGREGACLFVLGGARASSHWSRLPPARPPWHVLPDPHGVIRRLFGIRTCGAATMVVDRGRVDIMLPRLLRPYAVCQVVVTRLAEQECGGT